MNVNRTIAALSVISVHHNPPPSIKKNPPLLKKLLKTLAQIKNYFHLCSQLDKNRMYIALKYRFLFPDVVFTAGRAPSTPPPKSMEINKLRVFFLSFVL
jgi:hypothetical protein